MEPQLEILVNGKPWYQSKTILFNAACMLAEMVQWGLGANVFPSGGVMVAANLVNIGLRYVTKGPIQ